MGRTPSAFPLYPFLPPPLLGILNNDVFFEKERRRKIEFELFYCWNQVTFC